MNSELIQHLSELDHKCLRVSEMIEKAHERLQVKKEILMRYDIKRPMWIDRDALVARVDFARKVLGRLIRYRGRLQGEQFNLLSFLKDAA